MRKVTITYWESKNAPVGRRIETSLDQRFARFEKPCTLLPASLATSDKATRDAAKAALPGWAPTIFAGDKRANDNVITSWAVVLDLDKSPPFEVVCDAFQHVAGVVYTTWSHTPEAPRSRVIVPFDRPFHRDEHKILWSLLAGKVEGVDQATKAAGQFWYVNACIEGQEYRSERLPGRILETDFALWCARDVRPVETPAPVYYAPVATSSEPVDSEVEYRAARLVESTRHSVSGEQGRLTIWNLALGLVKGLRLPTQRAFELMCEWNRSNKPPWSAAEIRGNIDRATKAKKAAGYLLDEPKRRTALWRKPPTEIEARHRALRPPVPPSPSDRSLLPSRDRSRWCEATR